MEKASSIEYQPLTQNSKAFRLVRLRPRSFHAETPEKSSVVHCEIENAFRGDCSPYIALSYTWGDPNDTSPIHIGTVVHHVGANLGCALRELRDENNDVFIWVDQICINQQDLKERSEQVLHMREIYEGADHVVVWLGSAAGDSDFLLNHLRSVHEALQTEDDEDRDRIFLLHADDNTRNRVSLAFDKFCKRPYWTRLWVIQEFAVAQKLLVVCGSQTLTYDQLRGIGLFLRQLPGTRYEKPEKTDVLRKGADGFIAAFSSPAFSFVTGIISIRVRHQAPATANGEILFRVLVNALVLEVDYNQPQCTDPSDRIFSVLGLASDAADFLDVFPDYTKRCEDVYTEAARRFLVQGHIDMLSYCQDRRDVRDGGMPSWAPDWRQQIKSPTANAPWLTRFTASGDTLTSQKVLFPDTHTLSLQAVLIDTIASVSDVFDPHWLRPLDAEPTLAYLNNVREMCARSARIEEGEEMDTAARVASADRMHARDEMTGRFVGAAYGAAVLRFTRVLDERRAQQEQEHDNGVETQPAQPPLDPITLQMASVYGELLKRLFGRRPVLSSTGYVGLAPAHVVAGDEIWLVLGAKMPYILRPGVDGVYVLVGEAYVDGIMYGEGMVGGKEASTAVLR